MEALDPFYVDPPWTAALAGKTVLVASPFVDSIGRQYERRSLVWPGRQELLPDFHLELMRLPFSDGLVKSQFVDWFQALDSLRAHLNSRRFDVLLVGGGAFSLPPAVAAHRMGKMGIHLGGSTQILFGIRGARWDDHPATSSLKFLQRTLGTSEPARNPLRAIAGLRQGATGRIWAARYGLSERYRRPLLT